MRRQVVPLVVSGVVAAAVVPLTATPSAAASGRLGASAASASAVARLPTGDSVRISSVAGRPEVAIVPAHRAGITGRFQAVSIGQDRFVFPAEAQPFLGTLVDPSLFDVSALARLEHAGHIPVTINTAKGAHVHVPGLVVTGRSNRTISGYLAAHGAAALRIALAAACRTALRPGGSVPASLFGGVRHLAVTGAPAPTASPTPQFQMYTLKIKVLDAAGRPARGGLVGLINTDNARKYDTYVTYRNGGTRISVPTGHYSAITDVQMSSRHGVTDRIVPIADFSVIRNDQTITLDARTARSRVAAHTPRPAKVRSLLVEFDRRSIQRGSLGFAMDFSGPADVRIAHTAQARLGDMKWLTTWSLAGTARKHRPYTYNLSFLNDGRVSRDQSHTVAPFQFATVNARYYSDRRRGTKSEFARFPIYPFPTIVVAFFNELHTPVERTEYIYGDRSAVWAADFIPVPSPRNPFTGDMVEGNRRYSPGERRTTDWLRGPLTPGTAPQTSGTFGWICDACRTVHGMFIGLESMTDSTPGHLGFVSSAPHKPGMRFALYRGRKLLGHANFGVVRVPALAGRYRVHVTTNRKADAAHASTSTVTDLRFRSAAGSDAPLPDGWTCGFLRPDVCTVLPLLHAHVPLPTTLTDRLPIGRSSFVLTIAPIQGAKRERITTVHFETRLPGGTFRPAAMHRLSNGRYRVTLVNPRSALGKSVTIRVIGRDAAGDSITQTTRAAYFIGRR